MVSKLSHEDFGALSRKRAAEDERYLTIAARLRELFWDDSCNDITLQFYERLQREAIIEGPQIKKAIASVAASALQARNPVRYFAASISRRLHEMGYLQDGSEDLGI